MTQNENREKKLNENAYKNAYNRENYVTIKVFFRKDSILLKQLELLSFSTGKSRNSLILQAISDFLDHSNL